MSLFVAHSPRKAQIVKCPQGFWKNQLIDPGQNPHFPFLMCEPPGQLLIPCYANYRCSWHGGEKPSRCLLSRTRSNGRPRSLEPQGRSPRTSSYALPSATEIANIIRDNYTRLRDATSELRECRNIHVLASKLKARTSLSKRTAWFKYVDHGKGPLRTC